MFGKELFFIDFFLTRKCLDESDSNQTKLANNNVRQPKKDDRERVSTQLDEVANNITKLLNHIRSTLVSTPTPQKPASLKLEHREFFAPPNTERKKTAEPKKIMQNNKAKSSSQVLKKNSVSNNSTSVLKPIHSKNVAQKTAVKNFNVKNVASNKSKFLNKPPEKKMEKVKSVSEKKLVSPQNIAHKTTIENVLPDRLKISGETNTAPVPVMLEMTERNNVSENTEPIPLWDTEQKLENELEPFQDPELRPVDAETIVANEIARLENVKFDLLDKIDAIDPQQLQNIKTELMVNKLDELIEEALKPCEPERLPKMVASDIMLRMISRGEMSLKETEELSRLHLAIAKRSDNALEFHKNEAPLTEEESAHQMRKTSNDISVYGGQTNAFAALIMESSPMASKGSRNPSPSICARKHSSSTNHRQKAARGSGERSSKLPTPSCAKTQIDLRSGGLSRAKIDAQPSRHAGHSRPDCSVRRREWTPPPNTSKCKDLYAAAVSKRELSMENASRKQIFSRSDNCSSVRSINSRASSSSQSSQLRSWSHRRGLSCSRRSRDSVRTTDPLRALQDEVFRAIHDKKTFTVRGHFPAVRRALLRRGWVEKYFTTYRDRLQQEIKQLQNRSINELVHLLHLKDIAVICKRLIKSKLLANHQVDLYWGTNYESFQLNPDRIKLTKINKFRRDVFSYTSKQGLSDAAKNAHWYHFPGVANINHPRTYALSKKHETDDFVRDFNRTAAMSLLKWAVRNHETKECKVISPSGKIPLEAFQFAANECLKLLISARNEDIDQPIREATEREWSQFLQYFYKILHIGNHFKVSPLETEETIVSKSRYLIAELRAHWPHLDMDGQMNIWILKPTAGSRGLGIHICRTLQYILQVVKDHPNIRYVAQKYIERPLLIFNTKFDIRQWFLISSAKPLIIWMYKDCYLRFSSQTYNLRKLHESIHLTNNSVQSRYQNASRDITLPSYNMWDSNQFCNYLSNIGYPDIYKRVIYTGMKEGIIAAVLMHLEKMDKRKNCFELYGADFMLTEDFKPWLIEINSSPALAPSTPITSRMCPQVLEDVIKVVVDYAANKQANTGRFEMIYKQPLNNLSNGTGLKLSGKPLPTSYFCDQNVPQVPKPLPAETRNQQQMVVVRPIPSRTKLQNVGENMRKTLESLLKFVQNEKQRRSRVHGREKNVITQTSLEINKQNSYTSTNPNISFVRLKKQLKLLQGHGSNITLNEQDEKLIDNALSMLKSKKNKMVVKFLINVIERMVSRLEEREEVQQRVYTIEEKNTSGRA